MKQPNETQTGYAIRVIQEEAMKNVMADLLDWCATERGKIGAIDGYDYRSGEEHGLSRAEGEIRKRLKNLIERGS